MKRLSGVVLVGLLAGLPMFASADALYFEFRPDYSQGLHIASSPQPVDQVFLPLNDHISAIDLWLSNGSVAGPITFQLYNPSSTLISTRTLTLPAIPDATPSRTKVVLPTQVPTSANQPYTLRMTTSAPSIRVYHAQQLELLAHNAVPQAAYTGGIARIGGEDRSFAFIFALYEDTETTVPVITNVQSTVLSVESVRLTFNASEPVDVSVIYAPSGQSPAVVDYSGTYTSCVPGHTPCSVFLTIESPGVEHSFTMTVRDVWGNTAQTTGTFTAAGVELSPTPGATTPPPTGSPTPTPTPDTVPPVISNIQVADVDHESVSIAWTTNEAANSQLVVQFGANRITAGGDFDSTMEFEHLMTVGDLGPLTPYFARIRSSDASGNETLVEYEFTTLAVPTPSPGATPTPAASPSPTPTISVGPSGGGEEQTVVWTPPAGGAPNGYRIDVIGPDGKLIKTIRTFDTSADLGTLPDGAQVIVYRDLGGGIFEKITSPGTVRSSASFVERLLTMLPYIVAGLGILLIGGALGYRKFGTRKQKPEEPPPTPPSSSPFTSTR